LTSTIAGQHTFALSVAAAFFKVRRLVEMVAAANRFTLASTGE
jgi:predicted alternative tryptophan synthase beta-subunit